MGGAGSGYYLIVLFYFSFFLLFCYVLTLFLSEWSIIAVLSVSVYYLFSLSPVPLTRS